MTPLLPEPDRPTRVPLAPALVVVAARTRTPGIGSQGRGGCACIGPPRPIARVQTFRDQGNSDKAVRGFSTLSGVVLGISWSGKLAVSFVFPLSFERLHSSSRKHAPWLYCE